jgi:hypothetical protein
LLRLLLQAFHVSAAEALDFAAERKAPFDPVVVEDAEDSEFFLRRNEYPGRSAFNLPSSA